MIHELGLCSDMASEVLKVLVISAVFLLVLSGIIVFKNRIEPKEKDLLYTLLDGADVFLTGRYLNRLGKLWRLPFVFSVFCLVFWYFFEPSYFCPSLEG